MNISRPPLAYSLSMRSGHISPNIRELMEQHVVKIQNRRPSVSSVQIHCEWQEAVKQYRIRLTATMPHNNSFVVSLEDTHLKSLVNEVFNCFERSQHDLKLGEIHNVHPQVA